MTIAVHETDLRTNSGFSNVAQAFVLLTIFFAIGCKLPSFGGATPDSLVASRQLCQRGISAIDHADYPAAESIMAQAVDACPSDWEARRYYAEALWRGGDQKNALEQIDTAMRLAPDNMAIRIRAAELRLERGELTAARRYVQEAIDWDPTMARAWLIRGRISHRNGEMTQSLADYQRALSYEPDHREALLEMAQLYNQTGRPDRALLHLQRLLESYPQGEEPQQVLHVTGLTYRALGRFDDACDALAQASRRGQPSALLLHHHAEAQFAAGRPEVARQILMKALTLDPQNAHSRALLEHIELAVRQPTGRNVW